MSTSKITVPNLACEFIGTYILVTTVGNNVLGGSAAWAALSIAASLMVMVYSLGSISGGHFNPAVTLACTLADIKGKMSWAEAGAYMVTQIVAAIFAGFTYFFMHGKAFNLEPGTDFDIFQAGAVEVLYTFMLCFVVLRTACQGAGNEYYGLAIGFVIVAGGYAGGWISKGAFNPAVAIGVDVASAGAGVYYCGLYAVFEFLGAALAVAAFSFLEGVTESNKASTAQKFVSEFLGTFFLVLTVGLNVLGGSPAPALSIAAALMCMIYALGSISGAHFNPAVTTAIAIYKKDFSEVPLYFASQLVGGLAAAMTYTTIVGAAVPLAPGAGHGWGAAAFAEIIYTFVLCFVVLNAAVVEGYSTFFGLAIGFCVVVGGYAIGSVSGGSLNPAVSFGLDTSNAVKGGAWMNCLAYTAFELVGAGLAAGATTFLRGEPKNGKLPMTKKDYGSL